MLSPLVFSFFYIEGQTNTFNFNFYFLTYFTQQLLIDLLQLNRVGIPFFGILSELVQARMKSFPSIKRFSTFYNNCGPFSKNDVFRYLSATSINFMSALETILANF